MQLIFCASRSVCRSLLSRQSSLGTVRPGYNSDKNCHGQKCAMVTLDAVALLVSWWWRVPGQACLKWIVLEDTATLRRGKSFFALWSKNNMLCCFALCLFSRNLTNFNGNLREGIWKKNLLLHSCFGPGLRTLRPFWGKRKLPKCRPSSILKVQPKQNCSETSIS